jgi:hypothetical protein
MNPLRTALSMFGLTSAENPPSAAPAAHVLQTSALPTPPMNDVIAPDTNTAAPEDEHLAAVGRVLDDVRENLAGAHQRHAEAEAAFADAIKADDEAKRSFDEEANDDLRARRLQKTTLRRESAERGLASATASVADYTRALASAENAYQSARREAEIARHLAAASLSALVERIAPKVDAFVEALSSLEKIASAIDGEVAEVNKAYPLHEGRLSGA